MTSRPALVFLCGAWKPSKRSCWLTVTPHSARRLAMSVPAPHLGLVRTRAGRGAGATDPSIDRALPGFVQARAIVFRKLSLAVELVLLVDEPLDMTQDGLVTPILLLLCHDASFLRKYTTDAP